MFRKSQVRIMQKSVHFPYLREKKVYFMVEKVQKRKGDKKNASFKKKISNIIVSCNIFYLSDRSRTGADSSGSRHTQICFDY